MSSSELVPKDLLEFLKDGRQLELDGGASEIGQFSLKSADALSLSTIQVYPPADFYEDPYEDLDGLYYVDAVDLVARSERYNPEGLLCWIPGVGRFASIDIEHGTVLSFPDTSWSDIAERPTTFLNAQWFDEDGVGEPLRSWLHFPFVISERNVAIEPYGKSCPLHRNALVTLRGGKPELFDVFRQRALDNWLRDSLASFPCAGVPLNEHQLLACRDCRKAERRWLDAIKSSIGALDATPNSSGWIQCPGCGIRFSLKDTKRFANSMHLTCGQRIRIVEQPS
jgi:hypothetical protein